MQHRVGRPRHGQRPHLAGGRSEQGQQFGRPAADVLVGVPDRLPFGLPGGTWLREGLSRPSFVLRPHLQAQALPLRVGARSIRSFLGAVSRSVTVTGPALRPPDDCAGVAPGATLLPRVPGPHRVVRIVLVLTAGSPSGARAALLQRRQRPGGRPVVLPVRRPAELAHNPLPRRGVVPHRGPPAVARSSSARPLPIETATSRATATPDRRPARVATNEGAGGHGDSAQARAIGRSLPARATTSQACSARSVGAGLPSADGASHSS